MLIYGLTIVDSRGDMVSLNENGTNTYVDSTTKLFTSKEERSQYAVSEFIKVFNAQDFKKDEDGIVRDYNHMSLNDLLEEVKQNSNTNIQRACDHICFEFFFQDMGVDIINRDDYIATKLWQEEDVSAILQEEGYEGTDDQVSKVINTGMLKTLGDCTDSDWDIIRYAVSEAGFLKKFVKRIHDSI